MSVLDLKHQLNRMLSERRGVSDRTANATTSTSSGKDSYFNDLADLKAALTDMISVRNGVKSLTSGSCGAHKATQCPKHAYSSYAAITAATSLQNALSIGDIDKALNQLTYCTCNSRNISGCLCQNNMLRSACTCNMRTIVECSCKERNGGKYAHGFYDGYDCSCLVRTTSACVCEARSASKDCSCDSRCSCEEVKEFSYSKPNDYCTCNGKIVRACSCNTQALSLCTGHSCTCHNRSAVTRYKGFTVYHDYVSYEWKTRTVTREDSEGGTYTTEEEYWERVPHHDQYTRYGYYTENCTSNVNSVNTTVRQCVCVQRCSCDYQFVKTSTACTCKGNIILDSDDGVIDGHITL